ncbi:hypothetical protein HPK19_24865 (plasmid) [Arthrobacter citreus]|nr:hypothetical protein HPK19_24865 [Arthrobacter citreus]
MATTNRAASVIVKSKFVLPSNTTFQTYIDYVDRDEAKRNEMYEDYSSYSQKSLVLQKINQKKFIQEKELLIERLKENVKSEKEKINKLSAKKEQYNEYQDYLDDLNSVQKLFAFQSEIFSFREKKELQDTFNQLVQNHKSYEQDFAIEEKILELTTKQIRLLVKPKQVKIDETIERKQNYLLYLEKRIEKEVNVVGQTNERLKHFDSYMDYMGNPEKTSSLFTSNTNHLDDKEKLEVKNIFQNAHDKGSIMWQDVISFDNKWLEEHGLYDSKTHVVDEEKMKDVVRLAMNEMLKKENMEDKSYWSAAIHYNTQNLHVHIATVQPEPTKERGKRKLKSLDAMKSKVINNIMDRSRQQTKINDIIRKSIVDSKKIDNTFSFKNRSFKKDFLAIYKRLPNDRRQWSYGYQSISEVKPMLDKLSKEYIRKYHKKDFQGLLKKLDKEVEVYKKTYGEGNAKRYENYRENKVNELYKRLGNAFLQEIKEYDRDQKKLEESLKKGSSKRENLKRNAGLNQLKYGIDRMLNSEYKNWKNKMAYQLLQQEIEFER